MKILMSLAMALALCLAVLAQSQDQSSQSGGQSAQGQSAQSQSSQTSTGDRNMSGTVSNDRKTFTSDKDNKSYTVSNPDTLKGHEGQHVAILVHYDPDSNTIHIAQIEAPPQ